MQLNLATRSVGALALVGSVLVSMMASAPVARAQPRPPELSAEAARGDLAILQQALTALHPGLLRYATPEQMEGHFAVARAEVAEGASRTQMVLLAARLTAAVHCSHTFLNPYNQAASLEREVHGRADKLPLTLRWIEGRVRVIGSVDPAVPPGSELLAIDGRPMEEIARALEPYLRSDGVGPTAKGQRRAQLDSGPNGGAMDRLYPLRFPPQAVGSGSQYRLTVRDRPQTASRAVAVDAVSQAARDQALPTPSTDWQLRIEGDTALMTLPTFAFWRSAFEPREWLARSFETLRGVPFLIIDVRRNAGGDDALGQALVQALLNRPLTLPASRVESAYERAPYALARHLETWDYDFLDRTGQVRRGPGRTWLLPDESARVLEPAAPPYAGRTIVLVGPQNTSAGFLLARDLKASGAATLVGQSTGGTLRGLNSGQLVWVTLPASGVAVDIPLLARHTAGDPPDSGVVPDVPAAPRWADAITGVDTELAAAQALVARWREAPPRAP